ncbi:hypothetical protein EVU91_13270 [Macrococcoides bohemicum]|uniref:hypothetical protein n=1 Tax=Macrococcoides bohemicum TaxID=1903056 RepID=UPI0010594095|nr:hypothetical protein [Macrococcus bohemicus]TDL33478.1 hypothetical protein EVU91_13270 [Macrococcus bohemicus]
MYTFLYYVMPVCIIALCLFGMFLWLSSQIDHLKSLRFTLPISLMIFIIGITISTWTPLSPLPFYQQHLHVQKVNEQYKVAESYLDNLMNKGFLDFNTTVKKHVTHRHFSVAQQKINRIDNREKRKLLMNKHSEYLAIYEQRIGDNLIRKIQLEDLSVSEYSQLTAQDYDNVRYQIRQQIQNPQTEKEFLERVQKLQKDHDSLYNYR